MSDGGWWGQIGGAAAALVGVVLGADRYLRGRHIDVNRSAREERMAQLDEHVVRVATDATDRVIARLEADMDRLRTRLDRTEQDLAYERLVARIYLAAIRANGIHIHELPPRPNE